MTREEQIIRESMQRAGIRSRADLSNETYISDATMRRRFRNPDKMTISELRRISYVCSMTDEEVMGVIKG